MPRPTIVSVFYLSRQAHSDCVLNLWWVKLHLGLLEQQLERYAECCAQSPEAALVCRFALLELWLCATKTINMVSLCSSWWEFWHPYTHAGICSLWDSHGSSCGLFLSKPFQPLTSKGCEFLNFSILILNYKSYLWVISFLSYLKYIYLKIATQ